MYIVFIFHEKHIFNKENLTWRQILPLSMSNFAPVTNQCPGLSDGPLHSCAVSTNLSSFWVWIGIGGPDGYTPESITTCVGGLSFSELPEMVVLNAERKLVVFVGFSDAHCTHCDCTTHAFETLVMKKRIKRRNSNLNRWLKVKLLWQKAYYIYIFCYLEKSRRRCKTVLESCLLTWSCAPVTMKAASPSAGEDDQLGSYFTAAVQTWENFFHWMGSK